MNSSLVSKLRRHPLLPLLFIGGAVFIFGAYYSSQIIAFFQDGWAFRNIAGYHLSDPPSSFLGDPFSRGVQRLYTLLLAPLFVLFSAPNAVRLAHIFNVAFFASTVVPVYLLAREVVKSRPAAYLAAALAITVPWLTVTTALMTENVAYPAFVWTILATQRTVAQPSAGRDAVALVAIAVAALARTQFGILLVVLAIAIIAHESVFAIVEAHWRPSFSHLRIRLSQAVRGHMLLLIAVGLGLASAALVTIAGLLEENLNEVLGQYRSALSVPLITSSTGKGVTTFLAYLTVGVGFIPVALAVAWIVPTLFKRVSKNTHAASMTFAVALLVLFLTVAATQGGYNPEAIEERYFFYAVPLLFVAMIACICDVRQPWPAVIVGGVAVGLLVGTASFTTGASSTSFVVSPASAFFTRVWTGQIGRIENLIGLNGPSTEVFLGIVTAVATVFLVLLLRSGKRRLVMYSVCVAVLVFQVAETRYALQSTVYGVTGADARGGKFTSDLDWIDDTVREKDRTAFVRAYAGQWSEWNYRILKLMFWNKYLNAVISFNNLPYTPAHFPPPPVLKDISSEIDLNTGMLQGVSSQWKYFVGMIGSPILRVRGRVIRRSPDGVMEIIETKQPLSAEWIGRGLAFEGWTLRDTETWRGLRVYFVRGEKYGLYRARISLTAPAQSAKGRHYEIVSGKYVKSGYLASGEKRQIIIKLCIGRRGPSNVRYRDIEVKTDRYLPEAPDGLRRGLLISDVSVVRISNTKEKDECKADSKYS